ncbi:MAG: UDP-N-acetylglucosamine 1-carboxyvinyltransferase, partial [Myxococcota bacterium]
MATFEVYGGQRLEGEITPQGAKNEALQVLCAVLLTEDTVVIRNIPQIRDVLLLIELLTDLGVDVEPQGSNDYRFQAKHIQLEVMKTEEFRRKASQLRGSIMLIGPLLGRFGHATLPRPGGDKIGRRRLDTHFQGLQALGASFVYNPQDRTYTLQ